MKLLVCIINNFYKDHLENKLKEKGFRITKLASSGGVFRKGSTTFLIGFSDQDLDVLNATMEEACTQLEERKKVVRREEYRYTSFFMNTSQDGEWMTRYNR